MRPLTFGQKLRILDHFAEESRWRQAPFPTHLYDELRLARHGSTLFKDFGKIAPTPGVFSPPVPSEFFFKGGVDSGAFFNVVDFDPHDWPDFAPDQLVQGIKLVIAFDCGIEPTLTYNNLASDSRDLNIFIQEQAAKEDWQTKDLTLSDYAAVLFKHMHDTTAFTGNSIGIPRHFSVSLEHDAQRVWMGVDQKTSILTQGGILRMVVNGPEYTAHYDKQFIVSDPDKLVNLLHNRGMALDLPRGQNWICIKIATPHAAKWAEKARHILLKELHIPSGLFGAFVYSPHDLILSVEKAAFDKAAIARKASFDVLGAIMKGSDDPELLLQLLEKGADLKYIDPDAAVGGKTFADHMKKHECFMMLASLKMRQGLHGNIKIAEEKISIEPQLGL